MLCFSSSCEQNSSALSAGIRKRKQKKQGEVSSLSHLDVVSFESCHVGGILPSQVSDHTTDQDNAGCLLLTRAISPSTGAHTRPAKPRHSLLWNPKYRQQLQLSNSQAIEVSDASPSQNTVKTPDTSWQISMKQVAFDATNSTPTPNEETTESARLSNQDIMIDILRSVDDMFDAADISGNGVLSYNQFEFL
eukprot:scaffold10147_cov121-Skeletonema_dohrnii-CCMP3373.AAC.2